LIQRSLWAPGWVRDFGNVPTTNWTYRTCQLNSYEDLDGNDFVSVDPKGTYSKQNINEPDGFVLIYEYESPLPFNEAYARANATPRYIGRTAWNASIWLDRPTANDPGAHFLSMNSLAQGVVLDIDLARNSPDASVRDAIERLMNWLNNPETPGSDAYGPYGLGSYGWIPSSSYSEAVHGPTYRVDADSVMVGSTQGIGYDLLNDPLGIIPVHPDPDLQGQIGRAVPVLNQLLNHFLRQEMLMGVECDWQQSGDAALGNLWVKENQITYSKTWPKQLNRLFR